MPAEPITILDGLVKGVILAAYDFVRLTISNLFIPFVSRSRRFWPVVFSLQRRLSSLTFLVLWILLSVSIVTGNSIELVSTAAGLAGKPDRNVFQNITVAFVISVIVDLGIRSCCLMIANHIKREMYETLMRSTTANIFFGAVIMQLATPLQNIPVLKLLFDSTGVHIFTSYVAFPNFSLILSSLPLGIIAAKAFVPKLFVRKIALGLLVATIVPFILLNISVKAFFIIGSAGVWANMFPPQDVPPSIDQKFTRCQASPGQIHLATYLLLKNGQSLVLDPREFSIGVENRPFMKITGPQAAIVLTSVSFVRVDIDTTISPEQENFPEKEFNCSLRHVDENGADEDYDFALIY